MSAHLYIEGGASKEGKIRCREAFRKLLEKAGFTGRLPRLTAGGGRESVFDDFKIANSLRAPGHFVAMLIDSEEPVADSEKTWMHLKIRDAWEKPEGSNDHQVLFMTTCMETWIVADRATLRKHYGSKLQEQALPPLENLEGRDRHDVRDKLEHATRNCANGYAKGKRSFEVLGVVEASALRLLPSFIRMARILEENL